MKSRMAVLALGFVSATGCSSVQEYVQQLDLELPAAEADGVVSRGDTVVVNGRFEGGSPNEQHEFVLTAPEGRRFVYTVHTGYPGGSTWPGIFTLLQPDPVDPNDANKWRQVARIEQAMDRETPSVSVPIERSESGQYVLKAGRFVQPPAGRFKVLFEPFVPTEVEGLVVRGEMEGLSRSELREYRLTLPQNVRFSYGVSTAFPGGNNRTAQFTLLQVDPVHPEDPTKWRQVAAVSQGMGRQGIARSRDALEFVHGRIHPTCRNVGEQSGSRRPIRGHLQGARDARKLTSAGRAPHWGSMAVHLCRSWRIFVNNLFESDS